MFKSADPTRRMPAYLQSGTKENVAWQLKLTAALIGFLWIKGMLEIRRDKKKYANL